MEDLEDKLWRSKYLIPVWGYASFIKDRLNDPAKNLKLKDYQDIQFTQTLMSFYQLFALSAVGYSAYYLIDKLTN